MRKASMVCFGVLTAVAMALAAALALLFVAALVLGGSVGAGLGAIGGVVAEYSIYVAALAVLAGLVHVYATGEHSLTPEGRTRGKD